MFSTITQIANVSDFYFGKGLGELSEFQAFHEGTTNRAFDQANGIYAFRYVVEPWSLWNTITDGSVDPLNYTSVLDAN